MPKKVKRVRKWQNKRGEAVSDSDCRQAFRLFYGEGSGNRVEADYRLFKAGWMAMEMKARLDDLRKPEETR